MKLRRVRGQLHLRAAQWVQKLNKPKKRESFLV